MDSLAMRVTHYMTACTGKPSDNTVNDGGHGSEPVTALEHWDTTIIPLHSQFLMSFDHVTWHSCYYLNNTGVPNYPLSPDLGIGDINPVDYFDTAWIAEYIPGAIIDTAAFHVYGPNASGITKPTTGYYKSGSTCPNPVKLPCPTPPKPPTPPPGWKPGTLSKDISFTTTARIGSKIYLPAGLVKTTNVMSPATFFYRIGQPTANESANSNILVTNYSVTFSNNSDKNILKNNHYACNLSIENNSSLKSGQIVRASSFWDLDSDISLSEHDIVTNNRQGESVLHITCTSSDTRRKPLSGTRIIKYFNLAYFTS